MDDEISFRPLKRSDFPLLVRWLAEPHVLAWWREPLDLAGLETKYGSRIDGIEPSYVFIIEYHGQQVGWIQWYRWEDYPKHAHQLSAELNSAGIDLAIGEPNRIGKGLGPRVIRQFLDRIVFVDRTITAVVSDPEEKNLQSLKAFEKAGFEVTGTVRLSKEDFQRCIVWLKRD